eukprot:TRINITY_DN6276_c0_g1_i1.p1 TRINITY_DN6276_c0_g1~~TRINITY_DN6276_c0_g1_i1.p1  ORF type:complete len:494 (+),score=111.02 TRINITY_DN6276_c0_g1_i1:41-1522(+)
MQVLSRILQNRRVSAIAALLLVPLLAHLYGKLRLRTAMKRLRAKAPTHVPFSLPFGLDFLLRIARDPNHTLEMWEDYRCKLGNTYAAHPLGRKMLVVFEPECVQHFLAKNFENYEKGSIFQYTFKPLLGHGIFNENGELWKYARNTARPHFQSIELGRMVPTFTHHAHTLLGILGKAADSKQVIDVQDLSFRFTLDSVGEILFGCNIDSLNKPSIFAQAFDYLQIAVNGRYLTHPLWLFKADPMFNTQLRILNGFVDKLVDDSLADPNIADRDDLLAEYIKDKQATHTRESLRDMLKNMLIAGRDTTAVLISWTLGEISSQPQVQERLLEEIREHVGDTEEPTGAQLGKLRYMKMVLNETLRLHPSVPADLRTAVKDDVMPNGTFVEAGTDVIFVPYLMHRMKEYWGEDALKFDPDRWTSERISKVPNFVFNPFLAGPRICLGQNMAYTEAKLFLTMVLRKFKLTLIPNHDLDYRHNVILQARHGMMMTVERR